MAQASCLMVQGTASSVGKSILVAALCRILRQDGYRVAPFKAQNMALNSFVTPEGGEIGRAQAVQAEAARIAPSVAMNPILLKPEADARSQVIVRGKPLDVLSAAHYYRIKDRLWSVVVDSLQELQAQYDVVVIEGAGSPAEVNLKDDDIVNMRVARLARAPVLLVGDIDRGGVIASLVGTLALLDPEECALVRGLVINKFRGDQALLGNALDFLEKRTGKPVLGVVPFLHQIGLAEEDSVCLEGARVKPSTADPAALDIAVVHLPHMSNFDDFDPLASEERVRVRYVTAAANLGAPDLVILPGSKTTIADLLWLRETGLARQLVELVESGTPCIGICAGFQMLGTVIGDPLGLEGFAGTEQGLGLLPATTVLSGDKSTHQVEARVATARGLLAGLNGSSIVGYEIHHGQTAPVTREARPLNATFEVVSRSGCPVEAADGALSENGMVMGTYIHGVFDSPVFRRGLLSRLALLKGSALAFDKAPVTRDEQYDRLAAHVASHVDLGRVYSMIGLRRP